FFVQAEDGIRVRNVLEFRRGLFRSPAVIRTTVTTAGSEMATRRVTIVWSAPTIAAAAGTGSRAVCGIEPCPLCPVSRTVKLSARSEERRVGGGASRREYSTDQERAS